MCIEFIRPDLLLEVLPETAWIPHFLPALQGRAFLQIFLSIVERQFSLLFLPFDKQRIGETQIERRRKRRSVEREKGARRGGG
jgi:hypothetical protein